MNQFSRWSGIVHSELCLHIPKIKLGQVHQLLAACLGHRTYASFRATDLEILNRKPRYVLFDEEAGVKRATELGLPLTTDLWRQVTMLLRPSGITPFWLTSLHGMRGAARLAFEDYDDSRIRAMQRAIGFSNGRWGISSRCHSAGDEIPDILRFDVEGEIYAFNFNQEEQLAIPVITVVEFLKVGRRMYVDGSLVSIEQRGEPRVRNQNEFDDDGDVHWLSED